MCGSFHLQKKQKTKNKRVCLGSYPHVNAHEKVNATSLTVVTATEESRGNGEGRPSLSALCFCLVRTLLKSIFMFYLGWKESKKRRKQERERKQGTTVVSRTAVPPQRGSRRRGPLCLPLAWRSAHLRTSIPAKGPPRGPRPRSQGHQQGFKQQQVVKKQKTTKKSPATHFLLWGDLNSTHMLFPEGHREEKII